MPFTIYDGPNGTKYERDFPGYTLHFAAVEVEGAAAQVRRVDPSVTEAKSKLAVLAVLDYLLPEANFEPARARSA